MKKEQKSRNYFRKEHEEAILQYSNSNDREERGRLYRDIIQPVFDEMIGKIIYTFKFNAALPNVEDLKEDCLVELMMVLDKFDPSKGSKAFTYFTVVAKNWFISKIKKQNKEGYTVPVGDPYYPDNFLFEQESVDDRSIEELLETEQFFKALFEEMKSWLDSPGLRDRDKQVVEGILEIFRDARKLEFHKRKGVNIYLKNITKIDSTKKITNSRNKLIAKYNNFKERWERGEI